MKLQGQIAQVRELKQQFAKNVVKKKIAEELEKELQKLIDIDKAYIKQKEKVKKLQEKLLS